MKKYLLVDGDYVKDFCVANTLEDAECIFSFRGWVIGEITTEKEYNNQYSFLLN